MHPPASKPPKIRVSKLERNGEHLFLLPDGDRHERRVQRGVISADDRIFWATITIACGTPNPKVLVVGNEVGAQWRRYGKLPHASNDLNAFFEYYRPMQLGDPDMVGAIPGLGKSPGFFESTERLNNPTRTTLREAMVRLRDWLRTNQADPEYTSCQLNFCFSGHGVLDAAGRASIVLADAELDSEELTSWMIDCIPPASEVASPSRLDLYLDCCHAAAVARTVQRQLRSAQAPLRIGQIYCACLDDEESYEFEDLPHGVFTFAFLNECSRKRPDGSDRINLGLRDVGWFTRGQQHPLLLDCTGGGVAIKIPSSYYQTHWPASIPRPAPPVTVLTDANRRAVDGMDEALRVAHAQRTDWLVLDEALARDEAARTTFSRDEILTNRRFPFL